MGACDTHEVQCTVYSVQVHLTHGTKNVALHESTKLVKSTYKIIEI